MENMNEELAFVGQLCDKIKMEAFDLQHIKVSEKTKEHYQYLTQHLITLSSGFHIEYDRIKAEFDKQLPEPTTKPHEIPLRTNDSGDYLTRMRKFDGRDSEDDKVDHFH